MYCRWLGRNRQGGGQGQGEQDKKKGMRTETGRRQAKSDHENPQKMACQARLHGFLESLNGREALGGPC
ncbi:hypothetical protein SBA5_50020 [Candidatus Sulfotelmatomonas gaucii]|uniref:Uncharacterized protein n=1 Tax=Candidatus Sulfuritelmatomonas gaucii TaxID=2043161 RepID=A0A2N9LQ94_9BACT|nr:hypothetical protein SBA5_50020 [Candidatus Sulfotelmatomonas gaucii]